jgi:FKBP-type peptidyl-prolyl cis-trans isomerase
MTRLAFAVAVTLLACASHETPTETTPPAPQPLPTPPVTASATATAAPTSPPTQVRENGLLEITDLRVGTGDELEPGDTVVVHYVGTLVDGTQFDSSRTRGQPFTTRIPGRVIEGWNKGLPGMRVGGLRRIVIAPELAYKDRAMPKIPANSTLVFEVELLDIKRTPP